MNILELQPGQLFREKINDPWYTLIEVNPERIEPWESIPEKYHGLHIVKCMIDNQLKHLYIDPETELTVINS